MHTPVERCVHCGYPRDGGVCRRCQGAVREPDTGVVVNPGTGNAIADFVEGFVAVFQAGASVVLQRHYRRKLTLPMLLNLLAFGLMAWGLFALFHGQAEGLLERLPAHLPVWTATVVDVGGILVSLLLTVVSLYFTFPLVVELVLSPFLDPLVEATEQRWAGGPMPALDPSILGGALAGLKATAQILILQLLLWIPMLLLSLTGTGLVLALAVGAWLNALVWFELPATRRGYRLRARQRLLRRNWARALGFGLAFQLGMLVPVFNILLLTPAAAVAAANLYFHFEKTGIAETSLAVRPRPARSRAS